MREAGGGMLQVLRFNWPAYGVAGAVLIAIPLLLTARGWPGAVVLVAWMAWVVTLWWTVASIAASYWIYDRSPLMTWGWIAGLLPVAPRRWVNIHSGLDESTAALTALFPGADGLTFDMFDPAQMTEPSIARAREMPAARAPVRVAASALPLRDGGAGCVFLLFAAHELRSARSREQLFAEVRRVLAPGGLLILAEHVRDVANVAAFGPGAWHFFPAAEWRRLGSLSGLTIAAELRITPFVRIWAMAMP